MKKYNQKYSGRLLLLSFLMGCLLVASLTFILGTDKMFPRPIEFIEKEVYHDRFFYTGLTTEYKIGERGYVYNKNTTSYDSVIICGYVIINNSFEVGEYSYLVSKESCYDVAETKNVFKYNFNIKLP